MPLSNQLLIRTLTFTDLEDLRSLRLRGLKEEPEAFGASYEESSKHPSVSQLSRIFEGVDDSFLLGAFDPNLIGILGFARRQGMKMRHKGTIWGMYVIPEARRQGVAKSLMREALKRWRSLEGLEEVLLAVTTNNNVARSFYIRAGFVAYGLEERALKLDEQYIDEELMSLSLTTQYKT